MTQPQQPQIKTYNSVPIEDIRGNIRRNLDLIDTWINQPCSRVPETAWIMSAGPTMKKRFQEGFFHPDDFQLESTRHTTFCVKHSLPILRDLGIVPYGCITLDPRSIDGVSTHGKKRSDLFAASDKRTIFYIASMTHPSVTEWLLDNGFMVVGWHAENKGMETFSKDEIPFKIYLGSCSAMRAVELVTHGLGFTKLNLVGFDCSDLEKPKDWDEVNEKAKAEGKRSKYMLAQTDSGTFHSTGELLAMAQDMQNLFQLNPLYSDIRLVGTDKTETLGGSVYDQHNPPSKGPLTHRQLRDIATFRQAS